MDATRDQRHTSENEGESYADECGDPSHDRCFSYGMRASRRRGGSSLTGATSRTWTDKNTTTNGTVATLGNCKNYYSRKGVSVTLQLTYEHTWTPDENKGRATYACGNSTLQYNYGRQPARLGACNDHGHQRQRGLLRSDQYIHSQSQLLMGLGG